MDSSNLSQPSGTQPELRGQSARAPHTELSTTELARFCSEETNNFLKQRAYDDRYCMEIFRRAIMQHDDGAWTCLYQQYAPLVLTWVSQRQSAATLLVQDGNTSLVNLVFAKFAQALTPTKISNFTTLAAVLKYLKMCVQSVVADEMRILQARQFEATLETIEQEPAADDLANDVVARLSAQDVWRIILQELNGEDERVLLYLAYVQGMKPGEICSCRQDLFPQVDDVYRIKRNVLERLRRNRRLQTLFQMHNS